MKIENRISAFSVYFHSRSFIGKKRIGEHPFLGFSLFTKFKIGA